MWLESQADTVKGVCKILNNAYADCGIEKNIKDFAEGLAKCVFEGDGGHLDVFPLAQDFEDRAGVEPDGQVWT